MFSLSRNSRFYKIFPSSLNVTKPNLSSLLKDFCRRSLIDYLANSIFGLVDFLLKQSDIDPEISITTTISIGYIPLDLPDYEDTISVDNQVSLSWVKGFIVKA